MNKLLEQLRCLTPVYADTGRVKRAFPPIRTFDIDKAISAVDPLDDMHEYKFQAIFGRTASCRPKDFEAAAKDIYEATRYEIFGEIIEDLWHLRSVMGELRRSDYTEMYEIVEKMMKDLGEL